jgi:hypothetical protein
LILGEVHGASAIASDDGTCDRFEVDGGGVVWVVGAVGIGGRSHRQSSKLSLNHCSLPPAPTLVPTRTMTSILTPMGPTHSYLTLLRWR